MILSATPQTRERELEDDDLEPTRGMLLCRSSIGMVGSMPCLRSVDFSMMDGRKVTDAS